VREVMKVECRRKPAHPDRTWCLGTGTAVRFASCHPLTRLRLHQTSNGCTKDTSIIVTLTRRALSRRTQIDCFASEESQPRFGSTDMIMWCARLVLSTLLVPVIRALHHDIPTFSFGHFPDFDLVSFTNSWGAASIRGGDIVPITCSRHFCKYRCIVYAG